MPKPEWGVKRTCESCGARFYDLRADPIICPECGASFGLEALTKPKRGRAAPDRASEAVETVEEDEEEAVLDDAVESDDDDAVEAPVEALEDDEESDESLEPAEAALLDDDDDEDLGEFGDAATPPEDDENR